MSLILADLVVSKYYKMINNNKSVSCLFVGVDIRRLIALIVILWMLLLLFYYFLYLFTHLIIISLKMLTKLKYIVKIFHIWYDFFCYFTFINKVVVILDEPLYNDVNMMNKEQTMQIFIVHYVLYTIPCMSKKKFARHHIGLVSNNYLQ